MTLSRRGFLYTAPAAALALTATPASARQPALRTRLNVKKLNGNSPDIKALASAIGQMRKLPGNDLRNWLNISAVHGKLNTNKSTNCKHGDWLFLPWHRGFLHSFELIVQQLSGHKNFALPYWKWEVDHALPNLFTAAGHPPEFDNNARPNLPDSGRKNPAGFDPDDVEKHFGAKLERMKDLLNANFTLFAGKWEKQKNGKIIREQGKLESGPHAFIHAWVGGDLLGGGSPFDPVFWMHHCNIDRLWDIWAHHHPKGTPDDKDWLTADLPGFCDGKGEKLKLTVEDVLGGELGYKYEGTAKPAEMKPDRSWKVATKTGADFVADGWNTGVGTAFTAVSITAENRRSFNDVIEGKGQGLAVQVVLGGFKSHGLDPRLALDVYLTKANPEGAKFSPKDDGFVGSIYVAQFADHEGDHPPSSFMLDATGAFRRLYPKGLPAKGAPSLAFVPMLVGGKKWEGKLSEVFPTERRIEVIYRDE
jgi:hypothetical protein